MTIDASNILKAVTSVTKEWTKQRKAEERGRNRASREYMYSDRVDFTDVAHEILPAAYQHASGGGVYPVSKRQFYYACREKFKELTGREIEYGYFAGTLLVQYMNRHPETNTWKVCADPRGVLTIPNAEVDISVPCGTLDIEQHLEDAFLKTTYAIAPELRTDWPSMRPRQRYQGVLFIEKKGFMPLLNASRIPERFDLAVIASEGQSVVAVRRFIDEVCAVGSGVPLLVVHDCDKAGFEISQRLTSVSDWAEENDRVTYEFKNEIDVHDLGLRLADAQAYSLPSEECKFNGRFAPDSICTDEEKAFLRSGRRYELNGFSSPQFVEWLEAKLAEHLPERLIPEDQVLQQAYRRAIALASLQHAMLAAVGAAAELGAAAETPKDLRKRLRKLMAKSKGAWDEALFTLAKSKLYPPDAKS